MRYYLGVDGGGTKTEALVADQNGVIIGVGKSGSSNPHFIDKNMALSALLDAISAALGDINMIDVAKAVICIPGMKKYKSELAERIGIDESKLFTYADEQNTFVGALGKGYGVVVLAGTGSFAIGVNKNGSSDIVGGWGPVIGDPGSGYWMAVRALQAVAREYDGLAEHTVLTDKIKNHYSIGNINALKGIVSIDNISPIAVLVKEAALEGDEAAKDIVWEAGVELAKMASAVITRLELDHKDYSLALTGGISNFGELIMRPFINALRRNHRNIDIVEPLFAPAVGAVMLAMKEDGISWNEDILNNLKVSYGKVR
ncbi:MAG: hypothetical protein PWP48_1227 [Clostridiales bacterium]|nr:hypothetical protein [Clostridiales bacterium]